MVPPGGPLGHPTICISSCPQPTVAHTHVMHRMTLSRNACLISVRGFFASKPAARNRARNGCIKISDVARIVVSSLGVAKSDNSMHLYLRSVRQKVQNENGSPDIPFSALAS
eukprot:9491539-Pyramimonas_sp.AAC.1